MKLQQHNKQKDILFILISSFVVVVAWIAFNLYHLWVTSTVSQEIQIELAPIDGTFDPQTLQQLHTREQINPLYELSGNASPAARIPSPSPETISASRTGQLGPVTAPITRQGQ